MNPTTDRLLIDLAALAKGPIVITTPQLSDRAFELLSEGDVQGAVNLAVSMVDTLLKSGNTSALDCVLSTLEVEWLPIEVVMAFLAASKYSASDLPARAALVARFEAKVRTSGRTDTEVDALLRYVRADPSPPRSNRPPAKPPEACVCDQCMQRRREVDARSVPIERWAEAAWPFALIILAVIAMAQGFAR